MLTKINSMGEELKIEDGVWSCETKPWLAARLNEDMQIAPGPGGEVPDADLFYAKQAVADHGGEITFSTPPEKPVPGEVPPVY